MPAIQKVLQQDQVDVVVGIVNSATALGAVEIVDGAKKLLVVANAGAGPITGSSKYIWRTSFTNAQVAYAIGKHLATTPGGKKGAYAMAADYAAGEEAVAGFKKGFEEGGGKIVGQAMTPFGTTQDFQPFLAKVRSSGAGAVYVFYAGAEAVSFVKQYKEFGSPKSAPLYGSGFLTEGGVLTAQGEPRHAASRPRCTTPRRSTTRRTRPSPRPTRRRPASRRPCTPCRRGTPPRCSTRRSRRPAQLDGDALSDALDGLGEITDSPRGPWSFEQQSPVQEMYLREVAQQDGAETNVVRDSLGQIAAAP